MAIIGPPLLALPKKLTAYTLILALSIRPTSIGVAMVFPFVVLLDNHTTI